MTRKWNWIPGGIAVLFAVGAAVVAGPGAWHDAHGNQHRVHGGHAVFISEDDARAFDLSELADGEVRVFGSTDKRITAERDGDTVTITHDRGGDGAVHSVTCLIDRDTCKILTLDDDPEKVMIMVEKRRECHDGVGDCDLEVEVGAIAGDAAHVVIEKLVDCEGDEDCDRQVEVVVAGAPHHAIHRDGGAGMLLHHLGDAVRVLGLGEGDHALLSCPEGDATLSVDSDEARETFLCPKHSVPLEPAAAPGRIKVIRKGTVKTDD